MYGIIKPMNLSLQNISPRYGAFVTRDGETTFVSVENGEASNIKFILAVEKPTENIRIFSLQIKNTGTDPIQINSLMVAEFKLPNFTPDRILENGWLSSSFAGYRNKILKTQRRSGLFAREQNPFSFQLQNGYLKDSMVNEWFTQIIQGQKALVIGAITTKEQFTQIYLLQEAGDVKIRVTCQLDKTTLQPNHSFISEKITLITGNTKGSLQTFANLIKTENKVRRTHKQPKGLCCAYYFQGNTVN